MPDLVWDARWAIMTNPEKALAVIEEMWDWIEGEFGTGTPPPEDHPRAVLARRSREVEVWLAARMAER